MKLQRYRDTPFGTENDTKGEFVKFDDVIALLRELSDQLDDPDVLYELEDNDLNGSILVDQCIEENV